MRALIILPILMIVLTSVKTEKHKSSNLNCELSSELVQEIASYEKVKNDILRYVQEGDFKRRTYNELSKFVDKFGARLSGSDVLEKSIDYMIELTHKEGVQNVTTEDVEVPHWVRGHESIEMLEPRRKNIALLGLGTSVGTVAEGITAEVVVVKSFVELDALDRKDVENKIVLFIPRYKSYGETVQYRSQSASKASAKGAVASLVKSITPFSLNTPHTGAQDYEKGVTKIPTAAITVEDAHLINRITSRGEKVVLNVKMSSSLETKTSRNTFVNLAGREKPEKMVIVSGHIDSWDVGQGAMDDGGGIFISWAVPIILHKLNLVPRRSIKAIFWTAEEPGLIGAQDFRNKHEKEFDNINFVMESDEGTFTPRGLVVKGTNETKCIVKEILKLFKSINAATMTESDSPGSDITMITSAGVPGASLLNANQRYFWYHHTEADTMDVESPVALDLSTALWTAVSYIIADLSVDLPR